MRFLKKHWSNILFLLILALFFIPQTRMFIQVNLQRLFSFSPSVNAVEDQPKLHDYHWSLKTLVGVDANLANSKNKVVVVNVWATWCPPCVAEMPSLQKLYSQFKNDVDFYFVSDEKKERLIQFLQINNYDFPVYMPLGLAPEKLQTKSLPTTYIISKDGNIVVDNMGAADWDSDTVVDLLNILVNNETPD